MVLTCTFIKYSINITSVIGIWTLNFPILKNCAKLMGGCQHTREVDVSHWPKYFPDKYLVLTHYMLSLWWTDFLTGLGQYLIQPGEVDQVMLMTTILVDIGYNYSRYRHNNTPDIIFLVFNLVWLSTWTTSIISCNLAVWGIYHYLNSIYHTTDITGT